MVSALAARAASLPLLPDPDEAREWAERELGDPAYQRAVPTVIDRIASAVVRFFRDLLSPPDASAWGPSALIVLAVLLAVGVVIGLLIWGRPRRVVRAQPAARALFDDDDGRRADDLRRDAEAAAARKDWNDAIVLRFRALARGLSERGLVDPPPGATARAFARTAGTTLPALAPALVDGAEAFDDVRYLRRRGTEDRYRAVAALDDDASRARADTTPTVAAPA